MRVFMKVKLYGDVSTNKEKYIDKEFEVKKTKIENWENCYLIEVENKEEWVSSDDFAEITDLNESNSKKVVLFQNSDTELPPYWFEKFMKKKGIDIYVYVPLDKGDCCNRDSKYVYVKDLSKYTDFNRRYYDIYYSMEYLGENTTIHNAFYGVLKNFNMDDKNFIFTSISSVCCLCRESKEMIEIAEEVNDETKLKIVSMPSDMLYSIVWLYNEPGLGPEEIHQLGRTFII